jgi:hypothetical protein
MFRKLSGKCFAFAGVLVLGFFLAGCSQLGIGSGDNTPPPPALKSNPTGEQLKETVRMRNAKTDNGETLRIVRTTASNRVREVQVNYDASATGIISGLVRFDDNGKIVALTMELSDHTKVEGLPDAGGMALSQGSRFYTDGKLMVRFKRDATGSKYEGFARDGTTPTFVQETVGSGPTNTGDTTFTAFLDDGKSVAFKEVKAGGARKTLQLFDKDGKLKYDEARAVADQPQYGYYMNYVGNVIDANGAKIFRVTFQEGPYDNGTGRITQIEELDTDGVTAKNTYHLSWWGEPPHPMGSVYANQDALTGDKRLAWQKVNDSGRQTNSIDSNLGRLLPIKAE